MGIWTATDVATSVVVVSLPALNPLLDYVLPHNWRVGPSPMTSLMGSPTNVDENRRRRLNPFTEKPRDPNLSLGISTLVSTGSDEKANDDLPSDMEKEKEMGPNHIAVQNSWAVSENKAEEGLSSPV